MSDSKSLNELVLLSATIENALIESGGEISPDLEKMLEERDENLPKKVDNYAGLIERLEITKAFYKQKADNLLKIAKACDRVTEKLEDRIKNAIKTLDVPELQGEDYRFKLVKSQPSLKVTDESLVPDSLKVIKQETVLDKKEIIKCLKDGEIIPGVELEYGSHLRMTVAKPVK